MFSLNKKTAETPHAIQNTQQQQKRSDRLQFFFLLLKSKQKKVWISELFGLDSL